MCSISSSVQHFLMKSSKDNHGEVGKIGKTKYQLKLQKVFTPRLRTFNDHLIVLMIADDKGQPDFIFYILIKFALSNSTLF